MSSAKGNLLENNKEEIKESNGIPVDSLIGFIEGVAKQLRKETNKDSEVSAADFEKLGRDIKALNANMRKALGIRR